MDDGWYGTIAGATFFAYWERNDDGVCEFIVLIDGYEIYRKSCYEGQSCRDSSDSVYATIGDESGTLTWTKREGRPLHHITDPDTGCITWFCGECECTCECLCVSILDSNWFEVIAGEICDTSYECDPPVWQGVIEEPGFVEPFDISVTLERGSYGECLLSMVVNGEDLGSVEVIDCSDLSHTFEMYDGTTISIACKVCSCDEVQRYPCECREDDGVYAVFYASLTDSTSSCDRQYPVGGPSTLPTTNKAWNDEDCVRVKDYTHLITAAPELGCDESDVDVYTKRVVWVKKLTDAPTPLIDNSIVSNSDWYIVVYNYSTDDILAIYYEYDICCPNDTPIDPLTSHLSWIRFPGVLFGSATYELIWYNKTTADAYGNCGLDLPNPVTPA